MEDIDGTPWACEAYGDPDGWPWRMPGGEEEDEENEEEGTGMAIDKKDLAKLALAEAIGKAVRDMTNPRGGKGGSPNLRTGVDDALRGMYEESGVRQLAVEVEGEQVGTVSARLSKADRGVKLAVRDTDAFTRWLVDGEGADYLAWLMARYEPELLKRAEADGVVPDGCAAEEYEEPASWLGTTLRVDAEKVASALGAKLPGAVAGFLEGEK